MSIAKFSTYIIKSTRLLRTTTRLLCINVTSVIRSLRRVRGCSAILQGSGHASLYLMQRKLQQVLQLAVTGVEMYSAGQTVCAAINKNTVPRRLPMELGRRLMSCGPDLLGLKINPILSP